MRLTRRLSEGARILQINMLDHVIVGQPFGGRPGYFSFKEAGFCDRALVLESRFHTEAHLWWSFFGLLT